MIGASAAIAMFWAALSSISSGPVPYNVAVAADADRVETPAASVSSPADADNLPTVLSTEQQELMDSDPDWRASARLYHAGGGGATGNDSLGCRPIAMRTVAVDPRVIPRRTKLFIRETVGMRLSDGTIHDGYWYASDTGGAIKGQKIDLYTGAGRGSMDQARRLNMRTLTIVDAGEFNGCPPAWRQTASR
ncbi:3D domain-containing protein [Brevundimonas sp. SORGH_AS_0993]|uniref:3D domain-containing protein n=1 Tax=Brevundimonas sp. SORGH_AS_0993 TaxID=3041794 RepID=UPI00278869A3|nr:3D domain-containing protein [Brevundimonas sp. SORGH_AS_0993]MDQ1155599.1 3D (Asp-Asp-Asp) domain-containing protein [Brevundimonas sp. SORGH_AS_0993]